MRARPCACVRARASRACVCVCVRLVCVCVCVRASYACVRVRLVRVCVGALRVHMRPVLLHESAQLRRVRLKLGRAEFVMLVLEAGLKLGEIQGQKGGGI